jgi:GxxExxY protein
VEKTVEPYTNSVLPPETDLLITRIIGCAITVHRELGPGFMENIYGTALAFEFTAAGIPFDRERSITVSYRGHLIGGQRVDFIVADAVIVEVKAVARFDPVFQAKLISYLRTTGIRAGLLMNFNTLLMKDGIRRFVV